MKLLALLLCCMSVECASKPVVKHTAKVVLTYPTDAGDTIVVNINGAFPFGDQSCIGDICVENPRLPIPVGLQ